MYASEPTRPAPNMISFSRVSSDSGSTENPVESLYESNRKARCVIVQYKNIIVRALAIPEKALTIMATFSTLSPAKKEKNLAIIMNNGAPGGCPICNLYELAMNSPQSQRLTVGSRVERYTAADNKNTVQPSILFASLNLSIVQLLKLRFY